jgi:hypothetical protein
MEQRAGSMGWFAGVVMRSSLPGWLSPVETTRRNSFPAKKKTNRLAALASTELNHRLLRHGAWGRGHGVCWCGDAVVSPGVVEPCRNHPAEWFSSKKKANRLSALVSTELSTTGYCGMGFAGVVMRSSLPGWLSPVETTRRNSFPAKKKANRFTAQVSTELNHRLL